VQIWCVGLAFLFAIPRVVLGGDGNTLDVRAATAQQAHQHFDHRAMRDEGAALEKEVERLLVVELRDGNADAAQIFHSIRCRERRRIGSVARRRACS